MPDSALCMTAKAFCTIIPRVHVYLREWRAVAGRIPNPELKKQAIASINTKGFHCEGGGIYALMAGNRSEDVLRFIVAYQTISDYLDNLCDRSTSLNPIDFEALHKSMEDALSIGNPRSDYYRYRKEREDGGYLDLLVNQCRSVLSSLPGYESIQHAIIELQAYYSQLQIRKHVDPDQRQDRLKEWFESYRSLFQGITWYEFAACTGSTLGIFCLVASAAHQNLTGFEINSLKQAYFPWVQGLHILMDYFIDREEDRREGDLNFCSYYADEDIMVKRLIMFFNSARHAVNTLPHRTFHQLVCNGLPAIYLADKKLDRHKQMRRAARKIIMAGGPATLIFFVAIWTYRRTENIFRRDPLVSEHSTGLQ